MTQSSKERYLSQKRKAGNTSGKASVKEKKPMTPFEKLVLFLLLIFIITVPVAYFVNKQIMVYVGLVNYFILGLASAAKPNLIIDIMRKNNERFEQIYGNKVGSLTLAIRVFGIFFVGVGIYFLYALVLQQ